MSSGHQTTLVNDNVPTEDFFWYHLARADGGVGLVVIEAHAVHERCVLTNHTIDAGGDDMVDVYRPFVADVGKRYPRVRPRGGGGVLALSSAPRDPDGRRSEFISAVITRLLPQRIDYVHTLHR